VDVYNKFYRSNGTIQPADFRFPYADGSFDFAFATSVFTHMFPADVTRYLNEVSRVLKPGGTCLLTFLLWNPESSGLVKAGASTMTLHPFRDCWVKDSSVPEEAVGLAEEQVRTWFKDAGLSVESPIHYGSWCGRERFLSYQDIIIARKPA
jgi:SAM-dependent methyltransferase